MNQTVAIPTKTIDEIFSRLDELSKTVKKISAKLFEKSLLMVRLNGGNGQIKKRLMKLRQAKELKFITKKSLMLFLRT